MAILHLPRVPNIFLLPTLSLETSKRAEETVSGSGILFAKRVRPSPFGR